MQRPAHGDGGDVRALLGQRGGREQTIATIVSGPASSTIDVSSSARSSSSSIPAAMWAAAWAAMRISGTPLSSRGRSMARTVSES